MGALSSPGAAGCMTLSQLVIRRWGWGVHTLRDGVNLEDRRFGPLLVGVVRM